ncbi:exopolysaccharide Pel transporter PelG [Alsobacter sp. SYSU BS001988]
MAGIGFALERLASRNSIFAGLQSLSHAAAVSAGPWLFTVLALAGAQLFGAQFVSRDDLGLFSVITTYNFAFSLVISGPVVLVVTRFLADRIYEKKAEEAPGALWGSLALLLSVQTAMGGVFYFGLTDLTPMQRYIALLQFLVVGAIWLTSVFLSALKSFGTISAAFASGLAVGCAASILLTESYGATGMLAGFTLGLTVVLYVLMARVLAEYPYPIVRPFAFMAGFTRYWELAAVGLVYNAAIWVDKWIMWLAPGRKEYAHFLVAHPAYDAAMFFAYLTIVPALSLILVTLETRFYKHYVGFYRAIETHATAEQIRRNHKDVVASLLGGFRNITVLQAVISYLAMLVAPGLIGLASGGGELVPIFRYGVLGALFHVLFLCTMVVISYFDLRRLLLGVSLAFFILNASLTAAMLPLGIAYEGYGYFLASLFSFLYAYVAVARRISRLPYMTFVANNPGLR